MATSIFLAQVFGLSMLLVGLAILSDRKHYKKMLVDFLKSPALIYFTGVMLTVLGLILVMNHNIWGRDWTLIITIFSWMTLLKGLYFLFLPERMVKETKHLMKKKDFLLLGGVFALILGVYLGYFGFFVY